MMNRITTKILAVLMTAILLTSCAGPTPTVEPVDMQATLNALSTVAVKTVIADLTKNAPTATPVIPTSTQTETPVPPTETPVPPTATVAAIVAATATATRVVVYATFTPTATATQPSVCSIVEQSPVYNGEIKAGATFDGHWKLKNLSDKAWPANDTDIMYVSGTKFQESVSVMDLGSNVAPDGTYDITIDMIAPKTAGTYTTSWAVAFGGQKLCSMGLTIKVIE